MNPLPPLSSEKAALTVETPLSSRRSSSTRMVSPRENVSIPLPSEHPPPPGPPCALLSPSCSGVGLLTPTLLFLGRLRGFCGLSGGVQFFAELVALPFGLFAPMLLFRHPLAQRGLCHFAAGTFGV